MAKLIILIGIVVLAVGLALLLAERFGLGRLPGDILIACRDPRVAKNASHGVPQSVVSWTVDGPPLRGPVSRPQITSTN